MGEQQPTPEWEITGSRPASALPQKLLLFTICQTGEEYSPDRTWIIFGTGAAQRLVAYLNALEQKVRELTAELQDYKDGAACEADLADERGETIRDLKTRERTLRAALQDIWDKTPHWVDRWVPDIAKRALDATAGGDA